MYYWNCLMEWGIMQPYVTISSFKALLRFHLIKKESMNFFELRGRGGMPIQRINYYLFILKLLGQTHQFAVCILLVLKLIQHLHLMNHWMTCSFFLVLPSIYFKLWQRNNSQATATYQCRNRVVMLLPNICLM